MSTEQEQEESAVSLGNIKLLASLIGLGITAKAKISAVEKATGLTFAPEEVAQAKTYDSDGMGSLEEGNRQLDLSLKEASYENKALKENLEEQIVINTGLTGKIASLESNVTSLTKPDTSQDTMLLDLTEIDLIPAEVISKGVGRLKKVGGNSLGDIYVVALPEIKEIIVKGQTHRVDMDQVKSLATRLPNEQHESGITNAQVLTLAELA